MLVSPFWVPSASLRFNAPLGPSSHPRGAEAGVKAVNIPPICVEGP